MFLLFVLFLILVIGAGRTHGEGVILLLAVEARFDVPAERDAIIDID